MSKCPPRGVGGGHTPHARVVALLPKAGPDGGALLLDDGTLVGDGLGSTHIADELLHWPCLSSRSKLGGGGRHTRSHGGGLADPTWTARRGSQVQGREWMGGWLLGRQGWLANGRGDRGSWGLQWWLILGSTVDKQSTAPASPPKPEPAAASRNAPRTNVGPLHPAAARKEQGA